MDRHQFNEEDREGLVAELTEQLLRDWNRKVAAGDKRATTDLQNTVLDRLSEADAAAIFIQALSDQSGADAHFAALVAKVMRDECEAAAENAVDAMERRRTESRNDNRIAQAELARALH
jgi:hypothetical protein